MSLVYFVPTDTNAENLKVPVIILGWTWSKIAVAY